jgi:anti-anti-sigma factor
MRAGLASGRDREFFVTRRRLQDGVLLSLRGELDLTTASVAEDELAAAERSHQLVVLDLRKLSFMDSTGLGLIVFAQRRARESGHRFVVVQGPPQIQRVLELTGLTAWVEVVSDPSSLLAPST